MFAEAQHRTRKSVESLLDKGRRSVQRSALCFLPVAEPAGQKMAILSCSSIVNVAFLNNVLSDWVQVIFLTESSDIVR